MKSTRLVYIVSEIDKSLHFEWICPFLSDEFQLTFILIGREHSQLEKYLRVNNVSVVALRYERKSDLPVVWFRVFRMLIRLRPDIVHTHLWIANLTGLTTAWLTRVRKRIYTRHHATIHHKKYQTGVKWDRLHNRLATHIIAISENVKQILVKQDGADAAKVRLIRHGFDFQYFLNVDNERIQRLREKYNVRRDIYPVVGVISRFTEWKGIQYTIAAFKELRHSFPDAHLILANAHGDHSATIDILLSQLPSTSFTKIKFEHDLAALYRLFDVFIHVPVDHEAEAFGQTYVEPLIIGIPCIFTLSGIAREFVIHRKNAITVNFRNSEEICRALLELVNSQELQRTLVEKGKESVIGFTLEKYLLTLRDLYRE